MVRNTPGQPARQASVSERTQKIRELKRQLSEMDYMTSKHADGEYSRGEWKAISAKRKGLREEIRNLMNE